MTLLALLLFWLIAANLIGFLVMLSDKRRAELGDRRVPEATLLRWSLFGGSLGVLAGQQLLRHKTRKQPIASIIKAIPVVQALMAIAWPMGLGAIVMNGLRA
ncbi:MAG: DUF1294 domain-containing protein, partial [Sphingomonadales bacterium]|nr:DUF1294 domain-containing protein [Sphingomonadales bacterium]